MFFTGYRGKKIKGYRIAVIAVGLAAPYALFWVAYGKSSHHKEFDPLPHQRTA